MRLHVCFFLFEKSSLICLLWLFFVFQIPIAFKKYNLLLFKALDSVWNIALFSQNYLKLLDSESKFEREEILYIIGIEQLRDDIFFSCK